MWPQSVLSFNNPHVHKKEATVSNSVLFNIHDHKLGSLATFFCHAGNL